MMTYEEALAYIHSVDWKGSRPGLERIAELTERLGHPEDSLRFIHVAGTNGKGSFCSMLDSVLTAAGYRVGLFTSPYIERFNERIRLSGEDISDEDLARDTETVRACASEMADSPTEFELITAIALVYYKRMGCDFVVLECGLGGRLDSTNIIKTPVLSVITGVDLDHTALLGTTPAEIAAEKAGIIKPGVPVLFGEGCDEAEAVIRATAEEKNSPYYRTDFSAVTGVRSSLDGTDFSFRGKPQHLSLLGLYQTRNAATVLAAVSLLRAEGICVPEDDVQKGLRRARWSARFEPLSRSPLIVYDGAHNPQGIEAAAENIRALLSPLTPDGKILLLMGVMADKDHRKMTADLTPLVSHVFTVTPSNARSLDAAGLSREFSDLGVEAVSFDTLEEGVKEAVRAATEEGRPLVCLGSLYMYADVKRAVSAALGELC